MIMPELVPQPTAPFRLQVDARLALVECHTWCHNGTMNLATYVETLREHLVTAAEIGGAESKAVVERLSGGLEAATRLVLLEAISAAADEITSELAPGSVQVRLRGTDPNFVVTPPSEVLGNSAVDGTATSPAVVPGGGEDRNTSRLNLRLPEGLKTRIEEAARREGLSLNAWLVRTAAAAVEGPQTQFTQFNKGSQRYTGWVR